MRKHAFVNDEIYHIYNRGVDKRSIFMDRDDLDRFLTSLSIFNTADPVGSLYEHLFNVRFGRWTTKSDRLVNIICYCLNPNHFHLLLQQKIDGGLSEFMKRLGGYTRYFNMRHQRSGVLFQSRFKSVHVDSNEYLLHLSAYINLNDRIHRFGGRTTKSSWSEYTTREKKFKKDQSICSKDIILRQFKNISEYRNFAEDAFSFICEKKQLAKELEALLLE